MFGMLAGNPAAEATLEEASLVLGADTGATPHGTLTARMFENRVAQPLLCGVALATWAGIRESLPEPVLFVGYSVGELAAYGCVGALGVRETLSLAQRRAVLMDSSSEAAGGMLALRGLDRRLVESLCREYGVEIAILNGPDHFVVGGESRALEELGRIAAQRGARTVRRLCIGVASHTSALSKAGTAFRRELQRSGLTDPEVPVVTGVDASVVRRREAAIATLSSQLNSPLHWADCMQTAVEMGARVFLELGPGNGLTRMLTEAHPAVHVRAVGEFRSLLGAVQWAHKRLTL